MVELVMDPADSGADPLQLAYVRTFDDYLILVKNRVGDLLYTYDAQGAIVPLEVVSTDPATGTAQLRPVADPTGPTSPIDYASPWSGGSTGANAQETIEASSAGVRVVKVGQGGSNGAWGTLFIPPTAGGDGHTGSTVNHTNTTAVSTATNIGFEAGSIGGVGGKGGDSYGSFWSGQPGGDGGQGGTVTVSNAAGADITTGGTANYGIFAYSRSGKAGDGGSGYIWSGSGTGGHGSDGGDVTVSNNGDIRTTGADAHGLYGLSVSGNGGNSGSSWGIVGATASGSLGGDGGNVTLHNTGLVWTSGHGAHGILGQSIGGTGGDSGSAGGIVAVGGSGAAGGDGANVTITNSGKIRTDGNEARGIFAQSIGGGGGTGGGNGGLVALSGSGSAGGSAGSVTVNNQSGGVITTHGQHADAIFAQSIGGGGGTGGGSGGLVGIAGAGGASGDSGRVTVTNAAVLRTFGDDARGIIAQSVGGGGGAGGGAGGLLALSSNGGGSGVGGPVTVNNQLGADITTRGARSVAIFAQSIGGGGGDAAGSGGLVALSGGGGGAGSGGAVIVGNAADLTTSGAAARGIFAQSVGGGGGSGAGSGGLVALSGSGLLGGHGGTVTVTNSGSVTTGAPGDTDRSDSDAIFAQSIGGGGGIGSGSGGIVGLAGHGGGSGHGGAVSVTNSGVLTTYHDDSRGIFAQSVGGGGGSGGGSGGLVALSGAGSAGGTGGAVTLTNSAGGDIRTYGLRSDALFAQSIGGGGGVGYGAGGIVALGGLGSGGGSAGRITLSNDGHLTTSGDFARGIFAQSIGGGGGTGGGSGGLVAIGGSGTSGSDGGAVEVVSNGNISTAGTEATAVYAQSIGGGGGSGASSGGPIAIGGTGTGGGKGAAVKVATTGTLVTAGDKSHGIFAQSIGGGGGDGGTTGGMITIGASAGTGNHAGSVAVTHGGQISTAGHDAAAIFAQSVGGGGGNGGGGYSGSAFGGFGIGGNGAAGGDGGAVALELTPFNAAGIEQPATLSTQGDRSTGLLAQSIGGGGGNGGTAVQGSAGVVATVAVAIGGSGGAGGSGGDLELAGKGKVITTGDSATGVLLQSVGGGGGNGGTTVAGSVSLADGISVSVAVGGSGGSGGVGGTVSADVDTVVQTSGEASTGFLAQSIGGGGGNGGTTVAASAGLGSMYNGTFGVSVGGSGGSGGVGGTVTVTQKGSVTTIGDQSDGIVLQSVGGGGGNGGIAISGTGGGTIIGPSVPISVGVGGSGGSGGTAGKVTAKIDSDVNTSGDGSDGVIIQSVGGGGGNGGLTVAASVSAAGGFAIGVNAGVGGSGGTAGSGQAVQADYDGSLITRGDHAVGLLAQSVGGGGGNAGGTVAGGLNGALGGGGNVNVGVGGCGGAAGAGGAVTLDSAGSIETFGQRSSGMIAQSIGGGGGNGGFSIAGGIGVGIFGSGQISASIGGFGAGGGHGGAVIANANNSLATHGDDSVGLLAQSVGGGGGNGGFSISAGGAGAVYGTGAVNFSLGGFGDFAGHGDTVQVTAGKDISTAGNNAAAFIAQSIGGGGGNGGFSVAGSGAISKYGNAAGSVGIGGGGGGGGNGGAVSAAAKGNLATLGDASAGILAQSIGGGGGNGGFNVQLSGSGAWYGTGAVGVGIGGFGAGGGHASTVDLTVGNDDPAITNRVTTAGNDSVGILAQSVGGGGGNGGFNVNVSVAVAKYGSGAGGVGVGGGGAVGGNGDDVTVNATTDIITAGDHSVGLLAQSVGGGGGNGGFNVSVGVGGASTATGGAVVGVGGMAGGGGAAGKVSSKFVGDVTTYGDKATAVIAQSVGGGGGNGGFSAAGFLTGAKTASGGAAISVGGFGGNGGLAYNVSNRVIGDIITSGENAGGVLAQSVGGGGGSGFFSLSGAVALYGDGSGAVGLGFGGVGGLGGAGHMVSNNLTGEVYTAGENAVGVAAQSLGGGGGNGAVNVTGALSLAQKGTGAVAIGVGGIAGGGGISRDVTNGVVGYVQTEGKGSTGILTQSIGGGGGNGGVNVTGTLTAAKEGSGNAAIGVGGFGGLGGSSSTATSSVFGGAVTTGDDSVAILTQSVGGGGGNGGLNVSAGINFTKKYGGAAGLGLGGFGGSGGDGYDVSSMVKTTTDFAQVGTLGDNSSAIIAQSIGGGGGNGGINVGAGVNLTGKTGAALGLGVGGFGGGGGNAGKVALDVTGQVVTEGNNSSGLIAQSIGGGGGNGGFNVAGTLALAYESNDNQAALASSIGVGGFAGGGGHGGDVVVDFSGTIVAQPRTLVPASKDPDSGAIIPEHYEYNQGEGSYGLLAQSVGGGGGNGGFNVSAGLVGGSGKSDGHALFVGVGGFGGGGGNAGNVKVTASGNGTTDIISSYGDGYGAIAAQSIGGGGGNGTLNVSGGLVTDSPISIGVGGFAGTAGTGGNVNVTSTTDIFAASGDIDPLTNKEIIMQSIVDAVVGVVDELTSGDANVKAVVDKIVGETEPEHSAGILAQSIGGGGGNGGVNISGGLAITKEKLPSVTFGLGGFGGVGAASGQVEVTHAADTTIVGDWTHGILAQSIAGGGGNGGFNASGGLNLGDTGDDSGAGEFYDVTAVVGIGGLGGVGADAGDTTVDSSGTITVAGDYSRGIFAQSIGGGGGNGGMNVNGLFASKSSPITVGIGGSGLGGGDAGAVAVRRGTGTAVAGQITTIGEGASAIQASSIGGGGGDAGLNFMLALSLDDSKEDGVTDQSYGVQVAVGGSGAEAGQGGQVDVVNYSDITTFGNSSMGIMGQSIGGGGGNAHINLGLAFTNANIFKSTSNTKGLNVAIGGGTGDGGVAGAVTINHVGKIQTRGLGSYGILAQSIGGGGGNTAMNTAYGKQNGKIGLAIGGLGSDGGLGGTVRLSSAGEVVTLGHNSYGLLAQSIGNGGGNSGSFSLSGMTPGKDGEYPSADFGLTVGLAGGTGGEAGDVFLDAAGVVKTYGVDSHAVFAQSVGGSGGNAGSAGGMGLFTSAAGALSIGGTGGAGGTGGIVTVDSSAAISTAGSNSMGILAQSVGGGGGTGGTAGSMIPSLASNTSTLRIGIGGEGGQGMTADQVKVANDGTITTTGEGSHAILAQSVGGGGGSGGSVFNEILYQKTDEFCFNVHVSASLGGWGGESGRGADVDLVNNGTILTTGVDAIGLFAQSVGGGGGEGGTTLTGNLMGKEAYNFNLSVGGKGGYAESAGEVRVTNSKDQTGKAATITTYGQNAHGILAMSVGGGGGNGGIAITNSVSGAEQINAYQVFSGDLSIGGLGGNGGTGGKVTVHNAGTIKTHGAEAHGIIAQSVGGGGGNGGLAIAGDLSLGATGQSGANQHVATVALGGWGGSGDNAGDVLVENSGTIETMGDKAYGVYAQSVGGGGGNGGFAVALSRNLLTNPFQQGVLEGLLLNIGVGGTGGFGGSGGNVTVNHSGSITARGDNAYGIYAQTVAGGGGNMNYSLSSPVWMAAALAANVTLGLVRDTIDQTLDTTGTVTLNSTGDITITGQNSRASQAQTINGGGGNLSLFMDVSERAVEIGADGIEVPSNDPMLSNVFAHVLAPVQVGAKMAWKETGGDMFVAQTGLFAALGIKTIASQIQSIGGGGGSTWIDKIVGEGSELSLDLVLGAMDTFSSDGGQLTARKEGGIYTTSKKAQGASYQSVGGGGGHLLVNVKTVPKAEPTQTEPTAIAAPAAQRSMTAQPPVAGAPALTANVALGALASTENHGGDLHITHIGDTVTLGAFSPGLTLQSIGGGGADAHLYGLDALNVTLGGRGGTSGNGGNIDFVNNGVIATAGIRSHGLIMQSIGGGGGALLTDLAAADINLALSAENSGNGGAITFSQRGVIDVRGDQAFGVVAQSLGGGGGLVDSRFAGSGGGGGSGGAISLTLADNVVASGVDSTGIFAQSTGGNGSGGNIDLTLDGELVLGGSGTGVAVRFDGGAANSLTTRASLLSLGGINGMAILGTTGSERIDNFGTIIGDVDLGGGINIFANYQHSRYLPGALANLGGGGLLTNAGFLSPGDHGNVQTTVLTGDFTQTGSGYFLVDLDFAGNRADQVLASGLADVAGEIALNTLHPEALLPGNHQVVIVSGEEGVTNRTAQLLVPNSAVVGYQLVMPDPEQLAVGVSVDFSPIGLNRNLSAIGDYFNTLQLAGGSEAMAPVVRQLFGLTDVTSLAKAYDFMNPDTYDHFTSTAQSLSRQYSRSLLDRLQSARLAGKMRQVLQKPAPLGGGKPVLLAFNGSNGTLLQLFDKKEQQTDKYGLWVNGFGQRGDRKGGDGFDGIRFDARGVMLGFDSLISRRTLAGVSLGYTSANLEVKDGRSDGEIDSIHASLYGSYSTEALYVDGALSYARQDFDNKRLTQVLSIDRLATSQHHGNLWSAYAEAGYNHRLENWLIQPFAALNYSYLHEEAFKEKGADALSLRIESRSTESLVSDLGARLARAFETPFGIISSELSVAWNYNFALDDQLLKAGFAGAPGGSFTIHGRKPERHGALFGFGLNLYGKSGVQASLHCNKEVRDGYHSERIMGKLRVEF